jgi:aspartate aminotransferase
VDAMDTLPDTEESGTIFWATQGKKAAIKFNERQKREGTNKKFINCSLGQPDFPPFGGLGSFFDQIRSNLEMLFNNFDYTPTEGHPKVIEAVKKFIQNKHFHDDKNCMEGQAVCITNGAKEALTLLFKAAGERPFIVTDPGWVSYEKEIQNAQGTMVTVTCPRSQGFKITPDQLRAVLTQNPNAVFVLNNPSNPTGAVYSKKELEAIAEVLREFPLALVVEDSIYNRVTKKGSRPPQLADVAPDLKRQIAQVFGGAKDGGLASERVAFFKAPLDWAKRAIGIKSNLTGNTAASVQAATLAYVKADNDKYIEECNEEYRKRFDEVQKCCRALGLILDDAEGAFYAFPSLEDTPLKGATVTLSDGTTMQINNGEDFVTWCFDLGIALTPGGVFGKSAKKNIRISCATETPDMIELCKRITEHGRKAIMNDGSGRTVGQYLDDCFAQDTQQPLVAVGSGRG